MPSSILSRLKDAELCVVEHADLSFKVPKRAARSDEQVNEFVLAQVEAWLVRKVAAGKRT